MSGTLIDVCKHLSNLKHSIWENMNDHLEYSECSSSLMITTIVYSVGHNNHGIYFCPWHLLNVVMCSLSASSCDPGPKHGTPLPHPVR